MLPYQIGEWSINPDRGLATRHDKNIHLEPKAIALLNYLANRSGEVVSRCEILDAVWPGVVVGEEVITTTVAKLRRALQDDPKSPKLIETIPKRGYRVIALVSHPHEIEKSPGRKGLVWGGAALLLSIVIVALFSIQNGVPSEDVDLSEEPVLAVPIKPSVAVLPFINKNDDRADDYFVDGLTEELIADLSRVSGLFVIARNSSFSYKGRVVDPYTVGHELGVKYLIEGELHKAGTKLRLNIRLLNTKSGKVPWSEVYNGDINDIFQLQNMITAALLSELSVSLTDTEKDYAGFQETHKIAAYQAFLKGWSAYLRQTPSDFARAIGHFEKAIAEDPFFGRAQAALAAVYWESYQSRWYRRLGISPSSHAWQLASEHLKRSMVAPTPLAHKITSAMLIINHRFDEALVEANRAIAIDPNDPYGYMALAEAHISLGSPERAKQFIRKSMRLDPTDPAPYLLILGKAQLVNGDLIEAVSTLERATHRSPDNRVAWMALISAYGALGQTDNASTARLALNNLQRRDKIVSFTVAHAREYWPFNMAVHRERFIDGLRKAGVPEW